MSTGEQKHVVNFLLTQMTYTLLAKSPVKDAMSKAATRHQDRLRAMLTKEELEPIWAMRDTVVLLAQKLAGCQDVESLQHSHAYIRALVDGEVMVAVEEAGAVVGYETNR